MADLDATLDLNVRGTLLCLRYELAIMLAAGGCAIVNNASLADLVGSPDNAIYDASKHAVAGLTRSAALEVARQGLRVNAECVSSVETAMDDKFRAGKGITREQLAQAMPIGRICRPEEVAPAVLFLCSDEASFITGATLAIEEASRPAEHAHHQPRAAAHRSIVQARLRDERLGFNCPCRTQADLAHHVSADRHHP